MSVDEILAVASNKQHAKHHHQELQAMAPRQHPMPHPMPRNPNYTNRGASPQPLATHMPQQHAPPSQVNQTEQVIEQKVFSMLNQYFA